MCDCSSLNPHRIASRLSVRRLRHHGASRCYTKARSSLAFLRGGGFELLRLEPGCRRGRLRREGPRIAWKDVNFSHYPDPLSRGQLPVNRGGRCSSRLSSSNSGEYQPDRYDSLEEVFSSRLREGGAEEDGDEDTSDTSAPSSFDLLELKRELEKQERELRDPDGLEDRNVLIPSEEFAGAISDSEEEDRVDKIAGSRRGRQMLRRSSLLAKQVISVESARSLGFISELWVDTTSWIVVVVEVRPNLLSGEMEKLLLEDVHQVGDVVLVQDEIVMENELKMIGLDTLVGYNVVTSGRRNIGKVRGYSFNINSGVVESLELDSFGMSMIPSSLVSTYCLMVDDVIEVVSDTVVVHEGAVSRLQRLTKGFWDTRTLEAPWDEIDEFSEFRRRTNRSARHRSRGKDFSRRKFRDDWDLPMDF